MNTYDGYSWDMLIIRSTDGYFWCISTNAQKERRSLKSSLSESMKKGDSLIFIILPFRIISYFSKTIISLLSWYIVFIICIVFYIYFNVHVWRWWGCDSNLWQSAHLTEARTKTGRPCCVPDCKKMVKNQLNLLKNHFINGARDP